MTIVGGNLESKEIGLSIGLSGTYYNTVIDSTTGYLTLKPVDYDDSGEPVYAEEGYWISEIINLEDKFADFDKLFTTEIVNGASSYSIQTRVSDNGYDWSNWVAIAMDGTIQSETKQYIQVKITLYAGFVEDVFILNKSEYTEKNDFVEEAFAKEGAYIVPKLTSNTSSSEGFAFAKSVYSTSYPAWKVFDKVTSSGVYYSTSADISNGFIGFYFYTSKRITKYKITAPTGSVNITPKNFFLEASNDTTTGLDGNWVILDSQNNINWLALEIKEFQINNSSKYNAYRIRWTSNNGSTSYTGLGELDFYEEDVTHLKLKRDYEYDMTLDSTWSGEGSLHRKLITKDEWLRIDKMNVLIKE